MQKSTMLRLAIVSGWNRGKTMPKRFLWSIFRSCLRFVLSLPRWSALARDRVSAENDEYNIKYVVDVYP